MRLSCLAFSAMAVLVAASSSAANAAVTRDQFPPRTTGDLIALCSAAQDDPLMTASVNFCQGFAEGVVELALGYEAVVRQGQQPFCLPMPRPSHNEALAKFVAWANAEPKRLDSPPVIGLVRFLINQYPCPRSTTKRGTAN
jgi:Rap1a immunity proteins